jgi:DNA-binding phage protein
MTLKTIAFDVVAELRDQACLNEYLTQVFADGEVDEIVRALGHAARARRLAEPGADPSFEAVLRVGHELGLRWVIQPIRSDR